MKKIFLSLLIFPLSLYAQTLYNDLSNIQNLTVSIKAPAEIIPDYDSYNKLKMDIQLKLLAAKINISDKDSTVLQIIIDYVKSAFAADRIFASLSLIEQCDSKRIKKVNAVTYQDYVLFTSEKQYHFRDTYNIIMDKLLLKFLNYYLYSNKK